ncbi:HD-GYP domain-containing protein [Alkalibacter mobilis]|uniref:HD-GYP domain-containing protein n=1 Tax=Alkalibacter mobilis TaxID=2787712 RepID=UPI00189F0A52|nr:HD-GYP domain-containing protein [Alkalibacter mobilis]MBF7096348.1 HD-GYP domain-containing protein [Alkalibacter mobilis]
MRLVPVNSIKEGSLLAKTLYNGSGIPLLREGHPLNKKLLDRAVSNGVHSLYIHDEYSKEIIEDVISPDLRQKAIQTLKNNFTDIHRVVKSSSKYKNKKNNKIDSAISKITYIAKEFVDNILSQDDLIINLVDIKTMDDYTYQHCVNVAVLSIVLGIELNYDRKVLESMAIGALLHDFGKVFIPKEILLKPGKLTESEMEAIQKHPYLGYDYLKSNLQINHIALSIILEHHEKSNGSGYPNKLSSNRISPYAKVVSVCDVYDALTSNRPYREAMSPNEAIELLMGSCGQDFDLSIVKSFIRRIVPYPIGTMVELSNRQRAIIKELNPEYVLRPVVDVVIEDEETISFKKLDLMDHMNVVIKHLAGN